MSVHSLRSSQHAPGFHVFDAEPGEFACGYQECLAVVLWSGQATAGALRRIQELSRHMASLYPEGHLNVTFVAAGVPMPAEEVREGFKRIFDGSVTGVRAMSIVLDGEGFWASALRGAITSFRQPDARPARAMQVHVGSSLELATDWIGERLATLMDVEVPPSRLMRMLTEARTALTDATAPGQAPQS